MTLRVCKNHSSSGWGLPCRVPEAGFHSAWRDRGAIPGYMPKTVFSFWQSSVEAHARFTQSSQTVICSHAHDVFVVLLRIPD